MVQPSAKVIPINELKSTAQMTRLCKESNVPIVVTRSGAGEMVLMSFAVYEKTIAELRAAALINESLDRIASGEPTSDGLAFLEKMDRKYGE